MAQGSLVLVLFVRVPLSSGATRLSPIPNPFPNHLISDLFALCLVTRGSLHYDQYFVSYIPYTPFTTFVEYLSFIQQVPDSSLGKRPRESSPGGSRQPPPGAQTQPPPGTSTQPQPPAAGTTPGASGQGGSGGGSGGGGSGGGPSKKKQKKGKGKQVQVVRKENPAVASH